MEVLRDVFIMSDTSIRIGVKEAVTSAMDFVRDMYEGERYAFRGRDAPAQDCTPDGPSLSDQVAVLCLA